TANRELSARSGHSSLATKHRCVAKKHSECHSELRCRPKSPAFSKPRAERRYEVKVLQIGAEERRRDLPTRPGVVLFRKFLLILPKQIRFEIDSIARLAFAQGRDFTGVRNNPDAKTLLCNRRDGETDAINSNRALEHDVTHHLRRRGDFERAVLSDAFPANDRSHAVNVAGNEMPAEAAVHRQRSFEIDQRTDAGKLQVCSFPRFAQQIELKQLLFRARNQLHDGKTAAV